MISGSFSNLLRVGIKYPVSGLVIGLYSCFGGVLGGFFGAYLTDLFCESTDQQCKNICIFVPAGLTALAAGYLGSKDGFGIGQSIAKYCADGCRSNRNIVTLQDVTDYITTHQNIQHNPNGGMTGGISSSLETLV